MQRHAAHLEKIVLEGERRHAEQLKELSERHAALLEQLVLEGERRDSERQAAEDEKARARDAADVVAEYEKLDAAAVAVADEQVDATDDGCAQ